MKQKSLLALVLVSAMLLTGCSHRQKLINDIKASNQECPISLDEFGTITNFEYDYDKNTVIVNVAYGEDPMVSQYLSKTPSEYKECLRWAFFNEESDPMSQLLVDAEANIEFSFRNSLNGEKTSILFTYAELQDLKNSGLTDYEKAQKSFEAEIALNKAQCPLAIEDNITLVDIYDDGDNEAWVYLIDDQYNPAFIDNIEMQKEDMKDVLTEDLTPDDVADMLALGKGLRYVYRGSETGKVVEIVIPAQELKRRVGAF